MTEEQKGDFLIIIFMYTQSLLHKGNIQPFVPDNNKNGGASVSIKDDMSIFIIKHAC